MKDWNGKKKVFLDINDIGVLHAITKGGEGIIPFQVLDKMVRPFEYKALGVELAPGANSGVYRLQGTWAGVTLYDMFLFTDVDYLLHVYLEMYPSMWIYPSWISGYLQSDYADLLAGAVGQPFGFVWPPVDVIAIPNVHLDWVVQNPYGSETINPYIRFWYGWYHIKYLTDVTRIMSILAKSYHPEPKFFTVYGRKTFDYNFKTNMKITRPIPVDSTQAQVQAIVNEWRSLGQWK